MEHVPLVSVIMPVYNAERYVAQAIESILAQTFTDFEFLIADDGSTDRSRKILQLYAAKDPRICLTSNSNQGVSKTRNQLLAVARGELIAVMDADDIALPERFACQVEFLQQHPEVICVGACHELIDAAGRLLTTLILPEQDADIQREALAGHGSICHPCAMIRRSALLQIGGYDESFLSAHDLDVWLKLGEIGKLANLQKTLLKYRLHPKSVSGRDQALQRDEARRASEQAWKRRGITGQFEASDHWRPGEDRQFRHFFAMQYGWWAFNSRQRQTAFIYGLKAIAIHPFHLEGWKLLACAAIKPMPQ